MAARRTRAQLIQLLNSYFPDHPTNVIPPSSLRGWLLEGLTSWLNLADDGLPAAPGVASYGTITGSPYDSLALAAALNRPSNLLLGGPFYVSYRSTTQPGYEPGASTLADIPEALICFGARAYVSLSDDGPDSEYVPAFDYPAGPLHINKDGFFGPDNNIPARWVLKDSQEAADSSIRVIDNIIGNWRLNETGKAPIGGTYYYFGANAPGGPFAPPTTIAGTADWHAEAPPLAEHQFYQAITVPVAQAIALADTAIQPITYRILRGSDGTSRKGDIVVQGIAFSPGTESTEADVPARFATIGQWLDPDTEQWGMAFYDVATDTVEPVDFPRLAAQAASITRRNYDDVLSGESSISAAATWLGDDRTLFLNSPKFILTEPAVFVNGTVRGNGAAIQATSFLLSVSGTSFFDTTIDGGNLTVDGSNTLFTGGQTFAQTIHFADSSSQLFLRDVPAASVAAVTVAAGVTGCVIVLQNSTEWPDSLSLPTGVILRDERPKAVFVAIPANHWGAGDPPAPLLTVNAAIEHLHGHLSNSPVIISFTPSTGAAGTTITLTGTNFTGATSVTLNGVAITGFTVVNATTITFTVPTGATGGVITVTTPNGTATSGTSFTLTGGAQQQHLILCLGNSQTQGNTPNEPGDNSYPNQMSTLLPGGYTVINCGGNGARFSDLRNRVSGTNGEPNLIASHIDFTTYTTISVVIQEFTNSLAEFGPDACYDQCRDLVTQIKALDSRITCYVISPYYRYSSNGDYTQFNQSILAITSRMLGDYSTYLGCVGMLNVSASQYLDNPSAAQNPAILYDGTHATAAFNQVIAHGVKDMLLKPTGIQDADWVITTTAPTYGGTPHGTPEVLPYDSPVYIRVAGAWVDRGDIFYCFEAGATFKFTYSEGFEYTWGNGFEGTDLEFYKNGNFLVHSFTTASNALAFADYPTDGLTHTVENRKALAGVPNIIWPGGVRYV